MVKIERERGPGGNSPPLPLGLMLTSCARSGVLLTASGAILRPLMLSGSDRENCGLPRDTLQGAIDCSARHERTSKGASFLSEQSC